MHSLQRQQRVHTGKTAQHHQIRDPQQAREHVRIGSLDFLAVFIVQPVGEINDVVVELI